jgi:hypothetical protein
VGAQGPRRPADGPDRGDARGDAGRPDRNEGKPKAFVTAVAWRYLAGFVLAIVLVFVLLGLVGAIERWPLWAGGGLLALLLVALIGGRMASRGDDGPATEGRRRR